MLDSCVFENIYLESPEFLKLSFHTSGLVSIPISLLGFCWILFKTPKQMKSAKIYILNLHMCIVLLDFCLCFLTIPLFLFPAFARIGFGWFQYIGTPMIIETIIGVIFMGFTGFAILALFESRFYIICDFPGKKYWQFWRHVWLYGHYILYILGSFSFCFSVPDQDMALKILMKKVPCLPEYLISTPIFVFADEIGFHMVLTIVSGFIFAAELMLLCLFLVHDISKKLKNPRNSRKTVKIQKAFLMALFLQTAAPLVTIFIPLLYMFYSVVSNYYNQSFNNIGMVCMSTHELISTIVMIMVHRPYREAFFDMIGKTRRMDIAEVSMRTTKIGVIKY